MHALDINMKALPECSVSTRSIPTGRKRIPCLLLSLSLLLIYTLPTTTSAVNEKYFSESLYQCHTILNASQCALTEFHAELIMGKKQPVLKLLASQENLYPKKTWTPEQLPLDGTCCLGSYFRKNWKIKLSQPANGSVVTTKVGRRGKVATHPHVKTFTTETQFGAEGETRPEVIVQMTVNEHGPAGNPNYGPWKKMVRFELDETVMKFTSVVQGMGNPWVQAEHYIGPHTTVGLGKFFLARKEYHKRSVDTLGITDTKKGVSKYTFITPPEDSRHVKQDCHHELAWNPTNNTFFTMCSRRKAAIFEFNLDGKIVWSAHIPEMHHKDASGKRGSHGNSLSYDAATDEIIINDLYFGGLFGVSRRTSKVMWCLCGVRCTGKYVSPQMGWQASDNILMHMHQIQHIGAKQYMGYVNKYEVRPKDAKHSVVPRTGFVIMGWSQAENLMHVDRAWFAKPEDYQPILGGAMLLPGGNVVLSLCCPVSPGCAVTSVTPEGKIAWRVDFGIPISSKPSPDGPYPGIYRVAPKLKRPYVRLAKAKCANGDEERCREVEAWPILKSMAPSKATVTLYGSKQQNGCSPEEDGCAKIWTKEMEFPPHWQALRFVLDGEADNLKQFKVSVTDEWGLEGVAIASA